MMSIVIDKKQLLLTNNSSTILDVARKKRTWTKPEAAKFAKWLREKRDNSHPYLNQSALAKESGIARQYVSQLENADKPLNTKLPSKPGLDIVEKIALALRVGIDEGRQAAGYTKFPGGNEFIFRSIPDSIAQKDYSDLEGAEIEVISNYIDLVKEMKKSGISFISSKQYKRNDKGDYIIIEPASSHLKAKSFGKQVDDKQTDNEHAENGNDK